jgi:hypothetical protein
MIDSKYSRESRFINRRASLIGSVSATLARHTNDLGILTLMTLPLCSVRVESGIGLYE